MFTTEEATALFVGGELVKHFTDASLHEPMMSALGKLRAVLPRERQDHVERLVRHTLVLGNTSGAPDPGAQPWLLLIQRAVGMRRRLKMVYHGRERAAETAREVEPLGVVFYGGAWYMVGWCRLRNDFRHFKVDRIRELSLAEGTFEARPDFSLAAHMKEMSKREETIAVRVWFSEHALARAQRESHATLIREQDRDGGAEFALYTWSLEWMAGWLMSFGGEAEALAPKKLRELVTAAAQKIIENSRGKSS
jgi:predicted DNA-binding transcriptional regulator YafY